MASDSSEGGNTEDDIQYLLSEQKPSSLDQDDFDHSGHVKTLEKIAKEVDLPWHIGLYGTWGSGKSSVVHLLYRRIRSIQRCDSGSEIYNYDDDSERESLDDVEVGGDSTPSFEDTLCVDLNAWKHAEQSVRTELILDLNESIYEELQYRFGEVDDPDEDNSDEDRSGILSSSEIITRLYDEDPSEEESNKPLFKIHEWLPEMDPIPRLGVVASILMLAAGVIAVALQVSGNLSVTMPLSDYSGVLTLLVSGFGGTLLSIYWAEVKDARTDIEQNIDSPRKEWSGAYEELFNEIIEEADALYQHNVAQDGDGADDDELNRIIVTVDDVDRCESHTAYEILIALKSFLEHDKCLYIIPCDDSALHRHLEAVDQSEYLNTDHNQQNFLEKFFETEIEVPQPTDEQLRKYLSGEVDRLETSLSTEEDPDTLSPKEVLGSARLHTPRKIKRVLNRIVTNKTLAENRDVDLYQEGGMETDVDSYLTFVSVLQVNYPLFADEIQRDPEQLNEIYGRLSTRSGNEDELEQIYEQINLSASQRSSLTRFLRATHELGEDVTDPGPFFRLSEGKSEDEELFKVRFEREQEDLLSEMLRKAKAQSQRKLEDWSKVGDPSKVDEMNSAEAPSPEEQRSTSNPGESAKTVQQSEVMNHYIGVIGDQLEDDVNRYTAFQTMLAIIDEIPEEQRQTLGSIIGGISDSETVELVSGEEFDKLKPLFDNMKENDKSNFVIGYIDTLVDEDGLQWENVLSLLDETGGIWGVPETRDAFEQTIVEARTSGTISDSDYGRLLAYLKTERPELFTANLVEAK